MLTFRPIKTTDWPRILVIQRECYTEEFRESLSALQSRWRVAPATCFVAENKTGVIGYALSHPWIHTDIPDLGIPLSHLIGSDLLYVHDVAVSTAARGTGTAALLIQTLIAHATTVHAGRMALTSVQGSAPYWEKYGFEIVDTARGLKGYGKEAIYMTKNR